MSANDQSYSGEPIERSLGTVHGDGDKGVCRFDLTAIRADLKGKEAHGFCEVINAQSL